MRGRSLGGRFRPGMNPDLGRRSGRGGPGRFIELECPQTLLHQFKVLHYLLKFFFGIGGVAASASVYDPSIDQRPQGHREQVKPRCVVHRMKNELGTDLLVPGYLAADCRTVFRESLAEL